MKMNTTSARRANTARDPMLVDTALDLMNISSSSEEGFTVEQFSFCELEDRFRVGYSTAINYENTFRKFLLRLILFEKLSDKRKIHPLPKMTYMPTLGILSSDRACLMLSMNLMINMKTPLSMNLLLNPNYTALTPPKILKTVGGPQLNNLL